MSEPVKTASERNLRRTAIGVVSSTKMEKTISVEVQRMVKFPKYGKFIRRTTRYHAHDEKREAKQGDTVEIMETRPISRTKRWRLIRVVKRGGEAFVPPPAPDEKV